MAFPHILIKPVEVEIAVLDRDSTVYDVEAGEPMGQATRIETFTIKAQIHWKKEEVVEAYPGGAREDSKGYIVVLSRDLSKIGQTIKRGDRIQKIAGEDMDLYVLGSVTDPHWSATKFVKYIFADRHPVKQQGDL